MQIDLTTADLARAILHQVGTKWIVAVVAHRCQSIKVVVLQIFLELISLCNNWCYLNVNTTGRIKNTPALAQTGNGLVSVWRLAVIWNQLWSSLLTHIWVTRSRWVHTSTTFWGGWQCLFDVDNDIIMQSLMIYHSFYQKSPHPTNDKQGKWNVPVPNSQVVI